MVVADVVVVIGVFVVDDEVTEIVSVDVEVGLIGVLVVVEVELEISQNGVGSQSGSTSVTSNGVVA